MSTATIGDIYKPPIGREYRERGGDDHFFRGVSMVELNQRARQEVASDIAAIGIMNRMRAGEDANPLGQLLLQASRN